MRILMAIAVLILVVFSSQAFCQILEIHHINVGQGNSTLIVGPNGTTILVDAGNSEYFSLDGGKIVFEYLQSLGIYILDYPNLYTLICSRSAIQKKLIQVSFKIKMEENQ